MFRQNKQKQSILDTLGSKTASRAADGKRTAKRDPIANSEQSEKT